VVGGSTRDREERQARIAAAGGEGTSARPAAAQISRARGRLIARATLRRQNMLAGDQNMQKHTAGQADRAPVRECARASVRPWRPRRLWLERTG